jgi:hypothetical protein
VAPTPEFSYVEPEEDFGPDFILRPGDCEFIGICGRCDKVLGTIRPDQSVDPLVERWDRHVNAPTRCEPKEASDA